MPSPFPGMNPYLEQDDAWHDFHQRFTTATAETLGSLVAPQYFVKIDETLIDVERQPFLEIRDRQGRQVVTVIELLSPTNKEAGPDREQYLTKRGEFLASSVNFVEIDLLRGGGRLPHIQVPGADYCVFISRAGQRPRAGAWPIALRDRLPAIPIPLREGETEPRLDLQAILHRVYDLAYYAAYIYSGLPRPSLSDDDAEWARQFVPQA